MQPRSSVVSRLAALAMWAAVGALSSSTAFGQAAIATKDVRIDRQTPGDGIALDLQFSTDKPILLTVNQPTGSTYTALKVLLAPNPGENNASAKIIGYPNAAAPEHYIVSLIEGFCYVQADGAPIPQNGQSAFRPLVITPRVVIGGQGTDAIVQLNLNGASDDTDTVTLVDGHKLQIAATAGSSVKEISAASQRYYYVVGSARNGVTNPAAHKAHDNFVGYAKGLAALAGLNFPSDMP